MYKNNVDQVVARMSDLQSGHGRDQIYATISFPSAALKHYQQTHCEGETQYPNLDERHAFWDSYMQEQTDNPDDSMPAAYMSEFDEGLYTGLMGAEIRYMDNPDWGWISSMSVPFVESVEQLADLKINKTGPLAQQFIKQLRFFREKSAGKYGISHFILIDGCNTLIELRGATNMYYDVMDEPEKISEFFKVVRELNFWVQDHYFEEIGLYKGGTFSNLCQWCPGKIVSESLDPFHMASVDFFEQWGRDNIQQVFDHYDGGVIHIHTGNGLHLVKPASTLRGLKMMSFVDENFNKMKAWHRLDELDKNRGDIPMTLVIPVEAFEEGLKHHTLPGNVLYQVAGARDLDHAKELMEKVYSYRC